MSKLNVGLIGGGNMGTAILAGIRSKCVVTVCELDKRRASFIKRKHKVAVNDLPATINHAKVLILAVKPQGFDSLLKEIKPLLNKNHIIVSIAAGITTTFIQKRLGKVRVIRTMPNLPAQVSQGMTGLCSGRYATVADVRIVKQLFLNIGEVVQIAESKMDALTAISGSGPAYVFYFAECLEKAAKKAGFDNQVANILVKQTLKGSVDLLVNQSEDSATLRKRVTSKKGTTDAALKVLGKKKIDQIIFQAVDAAKKRSKALSK